MHPAGMARLARIVVPGVPHHVTQRGNRRLDVFFGDANHTAYIDLVSQPCKAADVTCLAWCLMPNHVHLILVPRSADGLRAAPTFFRRIGQWVPAFAGTTAREGITGRGRRDGSERGG